MLSEEYDNVKTDAQINNTDKITNNLSQNKDVFLKSERKQEFSDLNKAQTHQNTYNTEKNADTRTLTPFTQNQNNAQLTDKGIQEKELANSIQNQQDKLTINSKESIIPENKQPVLEENKIKINRFEGMDEDNILVKYDVMLNKFTFYDRRNYMIGSFTINQLMKYIGNKLDHRFMESISSELSEEIITRMVLKVTYDHELNDMTLILMNYMTSPFMGSIDTLIKLNNGISEYEKCYLENELMHIIDENKRKKIRKLIKRFIYQLITYTLNIISTMTREMKHMNTNEALKQDLLKYSVGLSIRLSKSVKNEIEDRMKGFNDLENSMRKLVDIKNTLEQKIDKLHHDMKKQNQGIEDLIVVMKKNNQTGGGDTTIESTKESTKDTETNTESENSDSKERNIKEKIISIDTESEESDVKEEDSNNSEEKTETQTTESEKTESIESTESVEKSSESEEKKKKQKGGKKKTISEIISSNFSSESGNGYESEGGSPMDGLTSYEPTSQSEISGIY